jgi:RNA recognition motif-containing protein
MDFFTQGGQFSSLQQPQVVPRTIFVGNLSIYCSESELAEIFSAFGKIESIHLKKKEQGNLSYCFVKFTQRAAAEYAIASLNGNILHGRPLRFEYSLVCLIGLIFCGFL